MADPFNAYKNPYNTGGATQFNAQVGATGQAGSVPSSYGNLGWNPINTAITQPPFGAYNVTSNLNISTPMANPQTSGNVPFTPTYQDPNSLIGAYSGQGTAGSVVQGVNAVSQMGGNTVASGLGLNPNAPFGGQFMSKIATSMPRVAKFGKAVGGAMGNLSTLATTAMPIIALGAAIGGIISSRRAKRREKRRKRREKRFAQQTQVRLTDAADRVGQDTSRQAQFQRDAFALQGEAAVAQYEGTMDKAQGALGATNLAGSGAGQGMVQDIREGYQLNARQRELAFAGDRYRLEQQYESRIRDIESSLLGLQQTAGQRGYSLGSVSVLDRLNRGIG